MIQLCRAIFLCALLLAAAVDPLAAAETVRVRTGVHEPPGKPAFGRIVFEWPAPVAYEAVIDSGRLVVRFARPLDAKFNTVGRILGDYVSDAVIEAEGRTAIFTLKGDFGLKSYADGSTVVFDLVRVAAEPARPQPPAARPDAPAAPQPSSPGAALAVRGGEHAGFGRLAFDWTRNVEYKVVQDGGRVSIEFDQPAKIDYVKLAARLPSPIISAEPMISGSGVGLVLKVPEDARLRHFRNGTGIVLDVLASSAGPRPARAAVASGAREPPAAVGGTRPDRLVPPSGSKSAASRPTPILAPQTATAAVSAAASRAAVATPENLLARPPGTAGQGAAQIAEQNATPPDSSLDEVLAAIPGFKASAPRPAPASQKAAPVVAEPPMRLQVQPLGTVNDLTGLRFAWPREVAAAIYERSGFLWLIFDRRAPMDIAGTWPRTAVKPQTVSNTALANATVLRWPLPQGKHPALRRDGNDWLIDLRLSEFRPETDIKPDPQVTAENGPLILLRGSSFSTALEWQDPEVGDSIWVVPMAGGTAGSTLDRQLAEVQFPATLQGLLIQPRSDGVTVRNVPQGIEVSMSGGMHLSRSHAPNLKPSGQIPITAFETTKDKLFDFAAWQTPENMSFFDRKRDLQQAILDAAGPSRNAARLALAQFFFAHGHVVDSQAILQMIEDDDADATKDSGFRSLRGANHFLRGDYQAASADLFFTGLDSERDTALWRAVLLASQADWIAASRYFAQAERIDAGYPLDLQMRFGLLAAEAAMIAGDVGLTKLQLAALARRGTDRVWSDQIDYLQGRVLARDGDVDGATRLWERVMAGVHSPTRVKASLARTEMLLQAARLTPRDAIEEIERLRFAWRGDDIELKVLKRLGELYIETGDYRAGLTTLREVTNYFPQAPEIPEIGQKMRAAFAALYLDGEADKLSPLNALTAYDEFRDLAPAGEAGDRVVANLVERLVNVELLERAAEVLKSQIDTRLKGAAQADAINRLAVIHLLARQPEAALALLNRPAPTGATPLAVSQRRQLTARTLGELTRFKEALALLESDTSPDADRLRAEIGWRTQNWPLASASLAKLVPEASQPMTDMDRQTVLRLAIAQALGNNAAGLKALRSAYGPMMAESAFKESFDLVTSPSAGPLTDVRAATRQVVGVDQFRAFLASYRDKLLGRGDAPGSKPLSSVMPPAGTQSAARN